MKNILYIIAGVAFFIWAIGFFYFMAGAIIHVLLLIGFIVIALRIQAYRNRKKNRSSTPNT